jgi:hypothetical protein
MEMPLPTRAKNFSTASTRAERCESRVVVKKGGLPSDG